MIPIIIRNIQKTKSEITLIIISFMLFKSSNSYLLKSFYPHYTKKNTASGTSPPKLDTRQTLLLKSSKLETGVFVLCPL